MNGRELANSVEQAELNNYKEAGKSGLQQFMNEYNKDQFKSFDKRRFNSEDAYKEKIVKDAISDLKDDGALTPVLHAWARNQLQPNELISDEPRIYQGLGDKSPRPITIQNQVDGQLKENVEDMKFQSSVERNWSSHSVVTAEQLDQQIAKDNVSVGRERVTKQLTTGGPVGELWRVLSNNAKENISLATIESAITRSQELKLSSDQVQALNALKSEWDADDGVKPFRINKESRLESMNPMNNISPFFGINPADDLSPFNHRVTKTTLQDYIGGINLSSVVQRRFDTATYPETE
jgi:hypothetical protein